MKCTKWVTILLMLVFAIKSPFTVSATDIGLVTQSLSDEEISDITKQREFVKITSYTPLTAKSFDVSDDHMVLIGASVGDTAFITVYDDLGIFQYGFKTQETGSFRVMWRGNAIAYYSIRSAFVFVIDEDGSIIDICRAMNTIENSIYDKNILLSTVRKVGNSTYSMTNESIITDVLSASYEKIIKTDVEGTTVIYDASGNRYVRVVGRLVVSVILTSIIVSGSIVDIKKHCHRVRKENTKRKTD